MLISDPIGDFLTRIRNAQLREKTNIQIPASKMLISLAEILKEEGFISGFQVLETEPQKTLEIELRYMNGQPVIKSLKRVSKPGIRKYVGYKDIPRIRKGLGLVLMSTPRGVMSGDKARAAKVGGEFLCTIY